MISVMEPNEALYMVMFSGGSLEKRGRRLRAIRRRYEARLAEAEAALVEARATLALIDRVLADFVTEV